MANQDDSLFEDVPYQAEASAPEVDDSLFEDVAHPEVQAIAPQEEAPSELTIPELHKTLLGSVVGAGAGKGASMAADKVLESTVDPLAEKLAYRAAGGYSGTDAGKKLNKSTAIKDSVNSVFDSGVNPNSVGREILDENLLGPLGLFTTKEGNFQRANANLSKKGAPTNAMLDSISQYPIQQQGVFDRTKELLGYDDLNETVPDQANIKGKIDKLEDKGVFTSQETPMQAERAKRDLQRSVDFSDSEKTVKESINAAQSTARKEAVEKAIENSLGPEKLAEFKALKAKSGSAAIAKDMLEETFDKSQKPFSAFNGIIGTGIDYTKQRGAGIGANLLDTASKGLKTAGKYALPGIGTLIGGIAGAAAADDQTDSADFIPGLDQAGPAGSAYDDKEIQGEVKARQNYEASPAGQNAKAFRDSQKPDNSDRIKSLENDISSVDDSFKNGFAYKQAQQELEKAKASTAPKKAQEQLAHGSKTLSQASPDQIMELSQSFASTPGAQSFVAPLENAAQASTESEMKARLFGLYQQPAFRQLLKKKES